MKLPLKISLIVALALVLIGAPMAYLTIYLNSRAEYDEYERQAENITAMIASRVTHEMIESSWQNPQAVLEGASRAPGVAEIIIYGHGGVVFASADPSDVGKRSDDRIVQLAMQADTILHRSEERDGKGEICVIRSLANKPKCQPCHGPEPKVLGAIEVGLDRAPLDARMRQLMLILFGTGFAGLVGVGVVLVLALRRVVLKPLARLADASDRMSSGDYRTRTDIGGKDELGVVARAFNGMAEAVERTTRHLEETVDQRTAELAGLVKVITSINRYLDSDKVLAESLGTIAQVTRADAACVFVASNGDMVLKAYHGLTSDEATQLARLSSYSPASGISPDRYPAQASVPLRAGGKVWGRVVILRHESNAFAPEAERFLSEIAEPLNVALEKNRLYEQVQQRDQTRGLLLRRLVTAQEEERKRVAREIHDEWGQKLTLIIAGIAQARAKLPEGEREMARKLDDASEMARQAMRDMRQLISELRPEMLDDLGLAPALKNYFRERLAPLGVSVNLEIKGMERRLSPTVELTLFRVLQEALSNVARHSGASTASVSLERQDHTVEAVVQDNGRGFDVEAVKKKNGGWGLRGMEERVTQLGGSLSMESAQGKGTVLRIHIPVNGQDP